MSRTGQIGTSPLTKFQKVQYCSNISMRRVRPSVTFAIVALLLPGLVTAAPIGGSCGRCGDGDACNLQQPAQTAPEAHSCCDSESEIPPGASLGSSNCECGREAPPALTAESTSTVETASTAISTQRAISTTDPVGAAFSVSSRLAAPPPAPPAYLIDCAVLT